MNINNKLTPGERANLLRSLGFKIRRNRGQINNIKNINYDDKNPDLCINLDTGQIRDFGNEKYSGDIVNLISLTIDRDFTETVKYMEKTLNRTLFGNDGLHQAKALYGDSDNRVDESPKEPVKFWNSNNWKRMQKCRKVLADRGIPKGMEYIQDYDGISLETLLEMRCGLYGFGDFEFGMSGKDYNKDLFYIFPYASGAMLYRRENGKKVVRNIKGCAADDSFFNVDKDEKKHDVVFVMKSPRECMNFRQYATDWKVIGIIAGETLRSLTVRQRNQLDSVVKPGGIVNIVVDCNNTEALENMLIIGKVFSEYLKDRAMVYGVNIYKYSDKKFKDFTDLVQYSMAQGCWFTFDDFSDLDPETGSIISKAITNAKLIR